MKKLCLIPTAVLCLSLCSCAALSATLADGIESMAGVEGKSYEEHEAYYQSELDQLESACKDLIELGKEELKNSIEDGIQDLQSENSGENPRVTDAVPEETKPSSSPEDDAFWAGSLKKTMANINSNYYNNRFSKGQCTWYAHGRFAEKTGIENLNVSGNAKEWVDTCNDDRVYVETTDWTNIRPNSIAVFYKPLESNHWGHVVFIEHVTYDDNGKPVMVYFTECNMDPYKINGVINPKWGTYNEGDDCIVKSAKYEDFISRSNGAHKIKGYIIPKE